MSTSSRTGRAELPGLSQRVARIGASATMAAGERAQRLRARGEQVLDLGPGQPDFDTPEAIKEAGLRAIREGRTAYTPAAGIRELRGAVAELYTNRDGVPYVAEETIITCGGKHGLYDAILALVEDGDEVIVPTPYWVSFPEQVKLAGGRPVFVDTPEDNGFALRAADVEAKISERTRLVIVNSPSNPSGAVIEAAELEALVELALRHGFRLLFDECYAALVYDDARHMSPLVAGSEAKEVTLICGSCSKSYAMTGWRIGWVAGPRSVVDALARLQSHTTSNPTSISQYAALEALTGDQEPVRRMLATFAERRARVLPRLRALPGVTCVEPRGAFYAFPNVRSLLGGPVADSADLAAHLVDTVQVVTVPGSAFGREGYLRLSYATSMETLEEALDRLDRACTELLGS